MTTFMPDRRYAKTHEWILVEGDTATVGVSDFAQEQMLDVVYAELPEVGRAVAAEEACAVIESSKAAADVMAPAAGEITEVNGEIDGQPELVNSEPFGAGWLFRMTLSDPAQVDSLMDAAAYEAHCAGEEH